MTIETLFPSYVKKYFPGVVASLVAKMNGQEGEPTYYFRNWFRKKFEPTLKYESLLASGTISAADVVATDSKLPLKMRDALSSVSGEIPKLGMKFQLKEGEMNNIDIMLATNAGGNLSTRIAQAIFGDVYKAMHGMYARLELMALESLSQGYTSITQNDNTGLTDVITFAIPSANQYGASVVWTDATNATPLDDIESILEDALANGDRIRHILMGRTDFNNFKKTDQVQARYAAYLNLASGNTIVPDLEKVNTFLAADWGVTIEIVESYVNVEKNGVKTNVSCWKAGRVCFLKSMNVGSLFYGMTAEERRPVSGVTYQKADDYMLISKFAENEPLAEYTAVQGYVIPVLDDVEGIYQLNAADTSW